MSSTIDNNSIESEHSKRHKRFGEALSLAIDILPTQLRITHLVRQMTEEERSLFQGVINRHPLMLEDQAEKERLENQGSDQDINHMKSLQETCKQILKDKNLLKESRG